MIAYVLAGLCAFCVVLFLVSQGQTTCVVHLTGESVRIHGCQVSEEFSVALSKLKPLNCGFL
jgi:hypothetical protein